MKIWPFVTRRTHHTEQQRCADAINSAIYWRQCREDECWSCGSSAWNRDENMQKWCDDCGQPWDRSCAAEFAKDE